ncbi:MAG TPA: serine hydrolase [Gemmatimonadaceae bacterium]|nr:serine hydrolase [Gemmatimonadaceae bacterium]
MKLLLRTLISVALAAQTAAAQTTTMAPPELDRFVTAVMKEFQVPGIGLAIVKDGRVVLAKGYGVRSLGKASPVDSRTRFGIASNTKIFTATALGMLVEEGKLEWDTPVIRYLPGFAMYDPFVTREITIRDLLVHRSGLGLGAGDLLWWPESTYDRKEIVRRLRFIPPSTSFRNAYAYDNVLYTVAGEVIEAVTGKSWEDFVSARILTPVGMSGSNVRHSDAGADDNLAGTHAEVEGVVRAVPPMKGDNVNPAGGINSSADDMARWLIVQLDSGRLPNGQRLFQPATTRELWTIVTPIPAGSPPPELPFHRAVFNGYALGMGARDYRRTQMLSHTGGLPGYFSKVTMIPALRLGIAVLTNQESGAAFNAISYRIVDHYLSEAQAVDSAQPIDYLAIYRTLVQRERASIAAAEKAAVTSRDAKSRPSLSLSRYAGTYTDPWYGDVVITEAKGVRESQPRLLIKFSRTPSLVGDLVHWQHDTFLAKWHDRTLRADAYLTFALTPDGKIDQAKMLPASPLVDFSFDFQDLILKPKTSQ